MIRRNDNEIVQRNLLVQHITAQNGNCRQIIDRNIEVALNLCRMQINRNDTVRTRNLQKIRNQLRRNRLMRIRLTILTRISVVWHDDVDFTGTCTLQRIDADKDFHQMLGHRRACTLNNEDRTSAHRLLRRNHDFAVCEVFYLDAAQRQTQFLGNACRKIRRAGESEEDCFLNHLTYPRVFVQRSCYLQCWYQRSLNRLEL